MHVAGAVALVTGGSSGLGAALCRSLARRGARVLVHGRDETRAGEVSQEVHGDPVTGDLSRLESLDDLAQRALDVHGRVDLLVNNAGRGWSGPFTRMTSAEVDALVAVNLTAPMRLTRALLPPMLTQGRGHVCFVSSVAGRMGVSGESTYAATKSGIDAFADSLRLETAGTGIGVSVAVPGVIDTPFFTHRGRPYDRTRPHPLAADEVADDITRMIVHGDAERWAPRWLRTADVVRHLAPGPYRRLATRFGEQIRVDP